MSTAQPHRPVGPLAVIAALVLAGCASSSIQTDAGTFFAEHGAAAKRAAAATKAVEADVSRLSGSPSRSQLQPLTRAAAQARRDDVQAGEWDVAKSGEGGEEGVEEEDLPRAETEATEGANELANAMSALQAYVRAPSTAALAHYRSELAHGQEQWDESVTQLWFLAHEHHPPLV
ncbi:MAG TPA: hypothetical protein VK778_04420 [Solirubrobacteraceae bacterium]|jgi:hypothetical protein|nr:hypothetical protein [Solirubrobacteraceae bacterium]